MSKIVINGNLINLDQLHFVRRESKYELLVSFGSDFLRFRGTPEEVDRIFSELQQENNEEFSCNCKR